MGRITGMHHLCVYTDDIEKTVLFYCDILGFQLKYRILEKEGCQPDGFYPLQYALVRLGNCTIEILQPYDSSGIHKNVQGAIDHIGLNVVQIEEVVDALKEKGVVFNSEVSTNTTLMNGFKGTSFYGPNGECIALYEFNAHTCE